MAVKFLKAHHSAIGVVKVVISVYLKLHRNNPDADFADELFGQVA